MDSIIFYVDCTSFIYHPHVYIPPTFPTIHIISAIFVLWYRQQKNITYLEEVQL